MWRSPPAAGMWEFAVTGLREHNKTKGSQVYLQCIQQSLDLRSTRFWSSCAYLVFALFQRQRHDGRGLDRIE